MPRVSESVTANDSSVSTLCATCTLAARAPFWLARSIQSTWLRASILAGSRRRRPPIWSGWMRCCVAFVWLSFALEARDSHACEPWCTEPCTWLNGDVTIECGDCPSSQGCHPGARGFEHPKVMVSVGATGYAEDPYMPLEIRLPVVPRAIKCDEPPPPVVPIPETACTYPRVPLILESDAKHLIYASPSGLLRVAIDCSLSSGLVGYATELGGRRAQRHVFYHASSGWTYRMSNSSTCVPFEPYVLRRLEPLCREVGEGAAPFCLQGGGSAAGEPVLHRVSIQSSLDASCVLARHHYFYGTHFLPRSPACPVPPNMPEGHLQRIGEQGQLITPVAEHAGCMGVGSFLREYVFDHRPLILRGCAHMQPAFAKWNDSYLSEVAGDWHRVVTHDMKTMNFAQYLANYRRSASWELRGWWHPPANLRRDVHFPPMVRCDALMRAIENLVVWLSAGGGSSKLHYDGGDFLIHQLEGRKRVTLVDPVDSPMLYADHVELYGETPVTPEAVDLSRFPSVAQLSLFSADISAGDVLYIPQGWWHMVDTEAGDTHRNLAVSMQFNVPILHHEHATGSRHSYELARAASHRRSLEAMTPELRVCADGQPTDDETAVASVMSVEDVVGARGGWLGGLKVGGQDAGGRVTGQDAGGQYVLL